MARFLGRLSPRRRLFVGGVAGLVAVIVVAVVVSVLAPGGVLAGLWNTDDDRVPWLRGFKEVARSNVSYTRWEGHAALGATPYFPEREQETFPHSQRRTAESLVATLGTHSHVLVLPDGERDELMGRVLAYLRANPETADGEFDLPLTTITVRTVAPSRM